MDQLRQQLGPELGDRVAKEIAKKLAERPPGSNNDLNINVIIEQQGDEPTEEQRDQMDIVREVYRQKLRAVPEEVREYMKDIIRKANNLGAVINLYKVPALLEEEYMLHLGDDALTKIANFANMDTFMRGTRDLMLMLANFTQHYQDHPVLYMELTKKSVYEVIEDADLIVSYLANRAVPKEEVLTYVSPNDPPPKTKKAKSSKSKGKGEKRVKGDKKAKKVKKSSTKNSRPSVKN